MQHGFYRGSRYAVPDETPTCDGTGESCRLADDGTQLESWGVQTNVPWQTCTIIFITCVACASVATGLEKGIVNLSRLTFALGFSLCLIVLLK